MKNNNTNFEKLSLTIKEQLMHSFKIENKERLKKAESFILSGIGGSALAGGIIKGYKPETPLSVHRGYGLPFIKDKKKTLIIFSSYSGNTEEVLSGLKEAKIKRLNFAIIAKGGKLIEIAKKDKIPYIQIPDIGLEPRMALGFSAKALAKIIGEKKGTIEMEKTAEKINFPTLKEKGEIYSKKIEDLIPVIYASDKNVEIAYNLKIKLNENAKYPAFYNEIPESNHNEISSFNSKTLKFAKALLPVFLRDKEDHARIEKRMEITKEIYKKEGFKIIEIEIPKGTFFDKYFISGALFDYITLFLAKEYNTNPISIPTIESLKKKLSK